MDPEAGGEATSWRALRPNLNPVVQVGPSLPGPVDDGQIAGHSRKR